MILFDATKRETHQPNSRFKKLYRRLRSHYKVQINKDELTYENLKECDLIIFGSPRALFSDEEFDAMKTYLEEGGSIAFFFADGGEESLGSNINNFLGDMGMKVEKDCVVRSVYHKYLHPKHAFISDGVLHKEIVNEKGKSIRPMNKKLGKEESSSMSNRDVDLDDKDVSLEFVYPSGATIDVHSPAVALLSSGSVCFPVNRPIAGIWEHVNIDEDKKNRKRGRVLAMGSSDIFSDEWIDKEENSALCDVLFRYLLHDKSVHFDRISAKSDFDERKYIPDIEALADRVKPCLQENDPLPQDYNKLLCEDLFRFDNNLIPEVIELYRELDVKHEPLTLISPEFECPLPPLRPAVFLPTLRDPPPPALDQFDLDEHFADQSTRLARLTNKCSDDDDLEYFTREVGEILGLDGDDNEEAMEGKDVLKCVFQKIVDFKMPS
mmetsp:Transcript_19864/g.29167  ORF Transcript_19864/g.29167 Transcript_19864/m.29167 type:complete len:437 (-) Transcript_19864:1390-2700(-)